MFKYVTKKDSNSALIKILANFFFARDDTKNPFYISSFVVFLNVLISLSFFNIYGFIIIPIATSISSWIGVLIFIFLLLKNKFILVKIDLLYNIIKIIISSVIMSVSLILSLDYFANYLEFNYAYKSIYLIIIIGFAGIIYLLSCNLLGLLKIKNFRLN